MHTKHGSPRLKGEVEYVQVEVEVEVEVFEYSSMYCTVQQRAVAVVVEESRVEYTGVESK